MLMTKDKEEGNLVLTDWFELEPFELEVISWTH